MKETLYFALIAVTTKRFALQNFAKAVCPDGGLTSLPVWNLSAKDASASTCQWPGISKINLFSCKTKVKDP